VLVNFNKALDALTHRMETQGVKTVWKETSKLNQLFAWFLKPVNPDYMARMVTTIGSTIYWPKQRWEEAYAWQRFATQAHEMQHVLDHRKYWYVYVWSYLLPQVAALSIFLAFGAFWNPLWWFSLFGLVFLIPGIPSPRAFWELRAYKVSHAIYSLKKGYNDGDYADYLAEVFAGPKYMWMYRDRDHIVQSLTASTAAVLRGEPDPSMPWLREVIAIIEENRLKERDE